MAEKYKIKKESKVAASCPEEDLQFHQTLWQSLSQNTPTLKIGLRQEAPTLRGQLVLETVFAKKRFRKCWKHSLVKMTS
jgi:hypothetical protein